ncbi:hypothetical protein EWM64_g7413 [Hericium alpestre]|uniref:Carbonic anhydrase n=1 Tax=Hericium alpestre TaxID=135208 RepID=A0A4Y9ZQU7_9AGAM|nr:hypothetical protein EWM64_g7413 [Hericium alpestre]
MAASPGFLKANEMHVAGFGDKSSLAMPPGKKGTHLGFKEGNAHVAGTQAESPKQAFPPRVPLKYTYHVNIFYSADAVRDIVISQRLLGTREIALFHHTGCGILQVNTPKMREIVKAAAPGDKQVAHLVDHLEFHEFSDVERSVKKDVEWLKAHPLLLKETVITGWVYEVETGKVRQIV